MKYIIEIENEPFGRNNDTFFSRGMDELYRAKGFKSLVFDQDGLDKLTPYTEPDQKAIDLQHAHDIENVARMNYSKGAEDAWELARRIICPSDCCEDSISKYTEKFLGIPSHKARAIFKDLSYREVKAKYEAWKKQRDEIRVGDEVIYDSRTKAVVVIPETKERYGTILTGDFATIVVSHDDLEKTGRHFDDIAELLKKMGDENNATHTKHSI